MRGTSSGYYANIPKSQTKKVAENTQFPSTSKTERMLFNEKLMQGKIQQNIETF